MNTEPTSPKLAYLKIPALRLGEKAKRDLQWQPAIDVQQGVRQLIHWVRDNRHLFDWLK